ncbi:uncharacterized protein LOC143287908 [Babylonia areolata]|uniref:uncharacterized protein LOC143287908 n=1 Tax=Babylonia areolata TaxID=304850 RepID=UPI003FD416BA
MEACIEALYTIDGESDKRKTLEMIRVLKGAISVSKSRTGEVIYHYNRHEKKALGRAMAKFDRDTARSKVNIESQKRDVLRKWNLVFGRQRKFTESMRGFDDMLDKAISTRHLLKLPSDPKPQEGEGEEKVKEEEEKKKEEPAAEEAAQEEDVVRMPLITDPRSRRLRGRPGAPQGVVATPAMVGVLPKLGAGGGLHNARIETEEEERARKEREKEAEAEEERQRRARELPRFDKQLMEAYLSEQRSLHEDLLTRNKLIRIKSSLDKDHVFFKYRLKSKLPDSAPTLLKSLERERTCSAATWAGPRLGARHGVRLKSSKSSKSWHSAAMDESAEEAAALRLGKMALAATVTSPDLQSHPTDQFLGLERAKTVHFS